MFGPGQIAGHGASCFQDFDSQPPPLARPHARARFDHEPHLRPAGLRPHRQWTHQKPDSTAGLRRKLQPPRGARLQTVGHAQDAPHAIRTQRLVERPAFIAGRRHTHHNQPPQVESRSGSGRRIKCAPAVDQHQRAMLLAGLASGGQGQPHRSAAGALNQPFNQGAARNSAFRKEPIELATPSGSSSRVGRPPGVFPAAQLPLQLSHHLPTLR